MYGALYILYYYKGLSVFYRSPIIRRRSFDYIPKGGNSVGVSTCIIGRPNVRRCLLIWVVLLLLF